VPPLADLAAGDLTSADRDALRRLWVSAWREAGEPLPEGATKSERSARRLGALGWIDAEVFMHVRASPFLLGKKTDWHATLPWVARHWKKIRRGDYAARPRGMASSGTEAEYVGPAW